MDRSASERRSGTTCALRASPGMLGRSRLPVCVDSMREPFGFMMVIGIVAGITSVRPSQDGIKWSVQPLLAMPYLLGDPK